MGKTTEAASNNRKSRLGSLTSPEATFPDVDMQKFGGIDSPPMTMGKV
ncbi:MAG: hypothetical protein LBI05_09520 [Planctomycetaceae bacterium]|nr:hypothetical protein [Planctomycetaceae bacterium]